MARHPIGHPPQIPATERTETQTFGPLRIRFWARGIFEVYNGHAMALPLRRPRRWCVV
ncbi:limonene-1,2-epoxide hydrolase family protein [Mycobacterium canetti]|uniref:limonene-1,2-epoxide hydrolase family protein n=1 Tax=Mycobacterium canetti TaxID=78331 RepID=UPI00031E6184